MANGMPADNEIATEGFENCDNSLPPEREGVPSVLTI
jgi:hypothetical protein